MTDNAGLVNNNNRNSNHSRSVMVVQKRMDQGERIMGILEDIGLVKGKEKKTMTVEEKKLDLLKQIEDLDKFPAAPIPSLPQFAATKEKETMVVSVSKKEKTIEEENKELKAKLQQLETGKQPVEAEQPVEPTEETKELTEIQKTVKEFYDEYGVFNASADNDTMKINLLFGILQELKKLNKKKGK